MATCNVQTLLNNAKCFACLSPGEWEILELQLLCEIMSGGGVGGQPFTTRINSPIIAFNSIYTNTTGRVMLIRTNVSVAAGVGANPANITLHDPVTNTDVDGATMNNPTNAAMSMTATLEAVLQPGGQIQVLNNQDPVGNALLSSSAWY